MTILLKTYCKRQKIVYYTTRVDLKLMQVSKDMRLFVLDRFVGWPPCTKIKIPTDCRAL